MMSSIIEHAGVHEPQLTRLVRCRHLKHISISGEAENQHIKGLMAFPSAICSLRNLEALRFSDQYLGRGRMPQEISQLTKLTCLHIL